MILKYENLAQKLDKIRRIHTTFEDIQKLDSPIDYFGRKCYSSALKLQNRVSLGYRVHYFEPEIFFISLNSIQYILNNLDLSISLSTSDLKDTEAYFKNRVLDLNEEECILKQRYYIRYLKELKLYLTKLSLGYTLDYSEFWIYFCNEFSKNMVIKDKLGDEIVSFNKTVCFTPLDTFKIID